MSRPVPEDGDADAPDEQALDAEADVADVLEQHHEIPRPDDDYDR